MTLRINRAQLPDDLDARPALSAFVDAIEAQEKIGGSDLNTIVTATARAIMNIETRLLALEGPEDEYEDEGNWRIEPAPGEYANEEALPDLN
ncbi:hypothetical protein [Microbacterium resistens]